MRKRVNFFLGALCAVPALALAPQSAAAEALDEITVAYFLEWPMPYLAAKAEGAYDEALGVTVNWVSFETGTEMSVAMAAGEVHLAISQGLPPFVAAVSDGFDLQIVDVAAGYTEHENCVVRRDLDIDKTNAQALAGKKVSVPLGTAAHYSLLRQMAHFGVDPSGLEIVDMAPLEGAAALGHGAVDFACGYGGGLTRMLEHGDVLLTGPEKADLGILIFDVTSAPAQFVDDNLEIVEQFIEVTAQANARWAEQQSAEMLALIADQSGVSLETARTSLAQFEFPSIASQLSGQWLGAAAAIVMKDMADVFADAGYISKSLPSYQGAINLKPLRAASGS
ncbi:MAG: ABC transporter substrate-binding protein [Pseudomonadota bacterium]